MHTRPIGPGAGHTLIERNEFDRFFNVSVRVSKVLAATSTRVELPPTVTLPTDRPVVIAANHSSLFDLVASLITLGHYGLPARIGVNERFFANPVSGWFLRGIGCVPFSRDNRQRAEDTMVAALERGEACALMPEGKIVRPADQIAGVGPGRPGLSRIVRRANAAVVPVGFAGSDDAWIPGTSLPKLGRRSSRVIASIGEPIGFDTDDHDANVREVMTAISGLVLDGRDRLSRASG